MVRRNTCLTVPVADCNALSFGHSWLRGRCIHFPSHFQLEMLSASHVRSVDVGTIVKVLNAHIESPYRAFPFPQALQMCLHTSLKPHQHPTIHHKPLTLLRAVMRHTTLQACLPCHHHSPTSLVHGPLQGTLLSKHPRLPPMKQCMPPLSPRPVGTGMGWTLPSKQTLLGQDMAVQGTV